MPARKFGGYVAYPVRLKSIVQRPLVPSAGCGDRAPLFPGMGSMRHSMPCLWKSPQNSQELPHKLQVSHSNARRVFSSLPDAITHGWAAGAASHYTPSPVQPLKGHTEHLHPAWQLPGWQQSHPAAQHTALARCSWGEHTVQANCGAWRSMRLDMSCWGLHAEKEPEATKPVTAPQLCPTPAQPGHAGTHSRLAETQRHEHHPICKSAGLAGAALLPLAWGQEREMQTQGHSSFVIPKLRLFLCNHLEVRKSWKTLHWQRCRSCGYRALRSMPSKPSGMVWTQ